MTLMDARVWTWQVCYMKIKFCFHKGHGLTQSLTYLEWYFPITAKLRNKPWYPLTSSFLLILFRSYRNPNQAEIMANFTPAGNASSTRPKTVPAEAIHSRPIVPSPYFFRHYPYNKNNSSASAKSLQSAPSQFTYDSKYLCIVDFTVHQCKVA